MSGLTRSRAATGGAVGGGSPTGKVTLRVMIPKAMRSVARAGSRHAPLFTAALVFSVGSTSAFAIPSPELVVGSFSSIAQLTALFSAIVGGAVAVAAMRGRALGRDASRRLALCAIALLILLAASVALNIFLYAREKHERIARLEQTLLRPASTPGGPKLDPKNLELSYAQMLKEPRGISTEETQKLLDAALKDERQDLLFLDVRETAERDMGIVPGATFVRFPDFSSAKIDFTGKKAILLPQRKSQLGNL
jgi:hypothetical protein